jgi:type IV secretory pathway TraG/TraD family ATPase VirD4
MTKHRRSANRWIPIYEPGQPEHAFNMLCELDPKAALIRIVRRKRESLINLREYGLAPVNGDDSLDKDAQE